MSVFYVKFYFSVHREAVSDGEMDRVCPRDIKVHCEIPVSFLNRLLNLWLIKQSLKDIVRVV